MQDEAVPTGGHRYADDYVQELLEIIEGLRVSGKLNPRQLAAMGEIEAKAKAMAPVRQAYFAALTDLHKTVEAVLNLK